MNPYTRFTTVSNLMAAMVSVGAVLAFGMPAYEAIASLSGGEPGATLMAASGAGLALIVLGWLSLTEIVFPLVFRMTIIRKMVLGKYFIEGTWLQAEKGSSEKRMSVIDIQPDGKRFIFSGYSLDENLEIQSNIMIEFSRFEWPFMIYKYRNSLSDGSDGCRDGVGEIQLEMNRASARRYNGFLQYVRSDERLKIEGAKLVSRSEINNLRELDGRQLVFEKYWKLFFHRAMKPSHGLNYPAGDMMASSKALESAKALIDGMVPSEKTVAPPPPQREAALPTVAASTGIDEAASHSASGSVVPRRRSTDWNRDTNARPIIRKTPTKTAKTGSRD